ncbi:hypothetical protein PoB_006733400 [Plakobranchus ocellatus]|uniref:Uncharacterized protein n=1 Tax=Plakobranchus ocellatus TaxID=259542 RepID=A0AAV4D9K9_9GAST|nr:hypothetical protein PoB_006733400 [Plakobranchus ocellatus]
MEQWNFPRQLQCESKQSKSTEPGFECMDGLNFPYGTLHPHQNQGDSVLYLTIIEELSHGSAISCASSLIFMNNIGDVVRARSRLSHTQTT